MIVICKKPNSRLLKGHRYEVQNLWNDGSNSKWLEGKVEILGFGKYSVDTFTDSDGNKIQNTNLIKQRVQQTKYIEFEHVEVGELIVCITDHYKTMAKDHLYKIEKLESVSIERYNWNNVKYTYTEKTIKLEGIKRRLKFNGWFFRKLTPEESREISLNSVLNGEEPNIIKTNDIRKFDLTFNKEKLLMQIISKTILDVNRHHLSIVDWSCEKTGSSSKIKKDDFNDILNMTLKDILEKIEN
jgi:hypothetical protein